MLKIFLRDANNKDVFIYPNVNHDILKSFFQWDKKNKCDQSSRNDEPQRQALTSSPSSCHLPLIWPLPPSHPARTPSLFLPPACNPPFLASSYSSDLQPHFPTRLPSGPLSGLSQNTFHNSSLFCVCMRPRQSTLQTQVVRKPASSNGRNTVNTEMPAEWINAPTRPPVYPSTLYSVALNVTVSLGT